MTCAEVREMLPAYLDDGTDALMVRRHLSRCADCRAQLAAYTDLMSGLRGLRGVTFEPSPHLKRALVAIPSIPSRIDTVRTHVTRNRSAYLGGAAAVLVAGAAGATAWRTRARHAIA